MNQGDFADWQESVTGSIAASFSLQRSGMVEFIPITEIPLNRPVNRRE